MSDCRYARIGRTHCLTVVAAFALLSACRDDHQPTVPAIAAPVTSIGAQESPSTPRPEQNGPVASSLVLPFFGTYGGSSTAFEITTSGSGRAAAFRTFGVSTVPALTAQSQQGRQALYAYHSGPGNGSTSNAALLEITNASNSASVLRLASVGIGSLLNAASSRGIAVQATQSGATGPVGIFLLTNSSNTNDAVQMQTNGAGGAMRAFSYGSGFAATIGSHLPSNAAPALWSYTDGVGYAAFFQTRNANNATAAVAAVSNGTGVALRAEQAGSTGDIAIFRTSAGNQARIDRNGTGFFNGGTQTGGADVAESFEVDGSVADYRPGDVLVISTRTDRRVTRSAEPYSTRVIGVYATKPGVLLTERGIDESQRDMVPVGVVGVIPTRVSAENGAIRRGDILVTAATPGHAMRSDPVTVNGVKLYPTGAILGKALQEFTGPGTGMIKVLVNLK